MSPPTVQLVRQVVWEQLATGRSAGGSALDAAAGTPAATDTPLFTRLARFVASGRGLAESSDPFPWGTLERLLQEAVSTLARSDDLFWTAHQPPADDESDYLAVHQARVAVLAIRVGGALGYEERRLCELGAAAALFDAGLWQLPSQLVSGSDPLSPSDQERYQSHPKLSAALLRRWTAPSDLVVDAVLQHHEREQGQGYPQGLRGPAIHPDAKIIGLTDAYAALTLPPAPRPARAPHDAVRELMRLRRQAFDPVLVRALVNETTLFPPGTLVRLSSGEVARVLELNRAHPLRPRIEVLAKPPAVGRTIDLVQTPFIYITGAVPQ